MTSEVVQPYRSARDLPSIREMEMLLRGYRLIGWIGGESMRLQTARLRQEMEQLVALVDGFYAKLGDRNWILHEDLKLEVVRRVISAESVEQAEKELLSWYLDADETRHLILKMKHQQGLRERAHLIEKAYKDFHDGRYYACVHVLLAVMDGFVNDFKPNENGLHSRKSEELVAWDSVVGHHRGLSHAHRTYSKTFRKLTTDEVFELYRHGIVHGMVIRFDNPVVACKAWNMLFSLCDLRRATERKDAPTPKSATWWETLDRLRDFGKQKRELDEFVPYDYGPESELFLKETIAFTAEAFLSLWQMSRYGYMVQMFPMNLLPPKQSAWPAGVRRMFEHAKLESFKIERVYRPAAAIAEVEVDAVVNGRTTALRMRWAREEGDKGFVSPIEGVGSWKLWIGIPEAMIRLGSKSNVEEPIP